MSSAEGLASSSTAAKLDRISHDWGIQIYHFSSTSCHWTVCPAAYEKSQLLLFRLCYVRWAPACWDELQMKVSSWSEPPVASNASRKTHLSSYTLTVKNREGFFFFFKKFWFWLLCRGLSLLRISLANISPNSTHEIHPGDQTQVSMFLCRVWIWSKVHVIAKWTPNIGFRADLFLLIVAGITFLTSHLQAGKFNSRNHGGATSFGEFLWKQSHGGMVQNYWHSTSLPVTTDQGHSLSEKSKENNCIMILSISSVHFYSRKLQLPANTTGLFRRKCWKMSWKQTNPNMAHH